MILHKEQEFVRGQRIEWLLHFKKLNVFMLQQFDT